MAILAALPGVEVSILMDGSEDLLTEYVCDEVDPSIPSHLRDKTTTCYVQSSAGCYFSFKLTVRPLRDFGCPKLGFKFFLDGSNDGPSQLCDLKNLDRREPYEKVVPGWQFTVDERTGETELFEFRFAGLETNELNPNDLPEEEMEQLKQLGMVEVRVFRHKNSHTTKPKRTARPKRHKSIPEKLRKGESISHRSELAEGKRVDTPEVQEKERLLDGDDYPIGVFRFKNRSKVDLQKMLIIARTPSPSPSPPLQPSFEDLDETEIKAFAKVAHVKKEMMKKALSRKRREKFIAKEFDMLSRDEKKSLAVAEFVSINGGHPVKMELGRAARAEDDWAGQKRKRPMRVTTMENGKLLFDLDSDDDVEDPDPAPAASKAVAEDEDEVIFVSAMKTVRGRTIGRRNAGNAQAKDEN